MVSKADDSDLSSYASKVPADITNSDKSDDKLADKLDADPTL